MEKHHLNYMEGKTCGLWTRQYQENNAEKRKWTDALSGARFDLGKWTGTMSSGALVSGEQEDGHEA